MADPGEIRVQDEQGNIHVFPSGSTPEMISKAMGVKAPAPSAPAAPDRFAQDRAITDAYSEGHPILGPIARFLVHGGQNAANTITGTPGALYHAITDPSTDEELGLTPEQRLVFRLGAGQAIHAGMDYASGKVSPKGAVSVLPEALGTGVGQVAGGAIYGKAGEIAPEVIAKASTVPKKAILLGRTPEQAYQSALKPSTTIAPAKVADIVQTGLKEGIPVSKSGLEKLGSLIDDVNQKITAEIGAGKGVTIDPQAVATRADQVRGKFATQVNPTSDLQAIEASKQEFLANNPQGIPAADAQAMKQGTYQQLSSKAYGELKGASIEAQKALARGLKEELAKAFPELNELNARDSQLYNLQPVLEKAIQREANHQIGGISTPITAGAAKAVTGSNKAAAVAAVLKAVVDNPNIKSRLAISLSKSSGMTIPAANARVAAYSAALAANAQGRADQSTQQSPQP